MGERLAIGWLEGVVWGETSHWLVRGGGVGGRLAIGWLEVVVWGGRLAIVK